MGPLGRDPALPLRGDGDTAQLEAKANSVKDKKEPRHEVCRPAPAPRPLSYLGRAKAPAANPHPPRGQPGSASRAPHQNRAPRAVRARPGRGSGRG